jgi:hypothetical protein
LISTRLATFARFRGIGSGGSFWLPEASVHERISR